MRRLVRFAAALALVPLGLPVSGQGFPGLSGAGASPLQALHSAEEARGWHAVGRLDTGVSFCTATLIAPDLVLTAAHCLFSAEGRRLPDADLSFAAGLRHGEAEAIRGVAHSVLPDGYVRSQGPAEIDTIALDVALLRLAQPVPVSSVRPIAVGAEAAVSRSVALVSYGAERADYPSIEEDCRVLSRTGRVLVLSCQVVSGSSGAPVILQGPSGPEIAAVVSGRGEVDGAEVSFAVVANGLVPGLVAAGPPVGIRVPQGGSITVRRVGDDTARDGIGALFLRP